MSLLIPPPQRVATAQEYNYSGRPTSAWGTTLETGGTAHTLGTKAEVIAATDHDFDLVIIELSDTAGSATVTDMLVNIYLGAASSEIVLISNLLAGWAGFLTSLGTGVRYLFPLHIPRGSRISADAQAELTGTTAVLRVELYQTGLWAGSGVETIGALTATSRGTQVTPGTTSDGSWTTLATTAKPWKYVIGKTIGNADNTSNVGILALDVGTGSALIPGLENFYFTSSSTEIFYSRSPGRYVSVPPSTALEARIQSHTTDTEAKSVIVYGVY